MTGLRSFMTAGLLIVVTIASFAAHASEASNIFVLKRVNGDFTIEAVPVAANEVKVVQTTEDIIDIIFPPGPGQSAGLISVGEEKTFLVRNTGRELHVDVRSPDGSSRELPTRTIDDLERHDIRVCVTGQGGRAAFFIRQNATATRDIGPIANMFAGRLPAEILEKAYVVQTDTYLHDVGAEITGRVPLEIDRWPIARVELADGVEADFIVDIGASGTIVDRTLLPDDIEIGETSMVEYSAAGKRVLEYAPGGATGQVQKIVGNASLDRITLGDVVVPGVTVDVMEEFPDMFGRPVGGIIGMDILRRNARLALILSGDDSEMIFGKSDAGGGDDFELPFASMSTHLVVEGSVNDVPVFFILDSGSPSTILDGAAADAAGIEGDVSGIDSARGLDEGYASTMPGSIEMLGLGDSTFEDVPCRISSLSVFDNIRSEDQHIGLLGNDFFSRFSRIEVDFSNHKVRFEH